MIITPEEVLIYVEIFFVIVAGSALTAVLWRAFFLMGRMEKILDVAEQFGDFLVMLENFPLGIIKAIAKKFF